MKDADNVVRVTTTHVEDIGSTSKQEFLNFREKKARVYAFDSAWELDVMLFTSIELNREGGDAIINHTQHIN